MIYNTEYLQQEINRNQGKDSPNDIHTLLEAVISQAGTDASSNAIRIITEAFSPLRLKLAEHMKLDNVLFLFGNGVSMYAGSKDTRAFKLDDYKADYGDLDSIIDAASKLNGVEEQLNALITARAYYHIVKDETKEQELEKLIENVKKHLIDAFVNSVDYSKLTLHDVFLRKLRSFGCLQRTSIYTPNYDLAFEYSLDKLGIEYKDGFSGFVNRSFDPRTLQGKDKTALVKIHGSVNWVLSDDKVKEIQPKIKDGKVEIDDTVPVLIYPTSNKLYQTYSSPYSELMRHMLDEMETGRNVIIVMGYKYGDDHINEILYKALRNPRNIFYFFLFGENIDGGFVGSIKALTESMPNVNLLMGEVLADFKVFVQYMLPATPEMTDQEKVIDLLQKVLVENAG